MKVVFLDIDGVLNSEEFFETLPYKEHDKYIEAGYNEDQAFGLCNIDSVPVTKLNYLLSQTMAKIVVSSSWRGSDPKLQETFAIVGIPHYIDITPYHKNRHRGTEIQMWLDKHPEVENYVILDDDNDMLEHQLEHFIQTNWMKRGLSDENVEQAINILNNVKYRPNNN